MAEGEIRFTDGAGYERFMGPWTVKVGAEFLRWLGAPKGGRWLDIGCGTGLFTELVLDAAVPAAVTAVDPAPAQIEHARGKPVAGRATFRVADAQTLPFAQGEFDVVVSALVFNFIPDLPRAVAEMKRVARPGGLVGGYVWDLAGELSVLRYIQAPVRPLKPDIPRTPGVEQSRIEALERIFRGAGLVEVAVCPIVVERRYASFDEYWEIFLGNPSPLSGFVKGLPDANRAALRAEMRAGMPEAVDGSITFAARANAVKSRAP